MKYITNNLRKKAILLIYSIVLVLTIPLQAQYKPQNDSRHKYFNEEINGVKLYYHIFTADSQKPYVFFLHGGPGGNSQIFEALFLELSGDKVNWVFMDQRGGGRSANFKLDPSQSQIKLEQVTPELMVEDIEQIRQKHNLGKIIIYGHSWGGNLAAYYTYTHPESLLGYIITSCTHNWKEDSEKLLNRNLFFVKEMNRVLKNWLKNDWSDELYFLLPQLSLLFDASRSEDIVDVIYKKESLNSNMRQRIEKIIDENIKIEAKLSALSQIEHSPQKIWDIINITTRISSYGGPSKAEIDHRKYIDTNPPNDVLLAVSNKLPKDNIWFYPQFKVPGVFWCGAYESMSSPAAMIPAAKLAPNSSYFVFPRSGHVYQVSEPLLFMNKLLEAIDMLSGNKNKVSLASRKIWAKLLGKFNNPTYGEGNVQTDEQNLVLTIAGIKIILEPVSDNEFIMHGGPGNGGKLVFEADANGQYNKFNGRGFVFERVSNESGAKKDSFGKTLWTAFEGFYQNNTLGECKIFIEGENLMGSLTGSAIKLIPISEKEFTMKGGPGNGSKVEFFLGEDGKCNSFNANGLIFKRL